MYFTLNLESYADLAQALSSIPADTTYLTLRDNVLRSKTGPERTQIFAAIPPSVTTLDLSLNNLQSKTAEELEQIFAAIPPSVSTLNLGANGFANKITTELEQIFAAIPASVNSLNLQSNLFRCRPSEDLANILAALPPGVASLGLMGNRIGSRTAEEIVQIFKIISPVVTSLNLRENGLNSKKPEELEQIFAAILANVDTIHWEGETIHRTKYHMQQLVHQVHNCITTAKGRPNFFTLPLTEEMDENCLNEYIGLLKKQDTPIAFLTAALLLDGQIPVNSSEEKNNCIASGKERTQNAIYFYLKAAEDKKLVPIINLLLWEIRTTWETSKNTNVVPLKYRLDCLSLTQPTNSFPIKSPPPPTVKRLPLHPKSSSAFFSTPQATANNLQLIRKSSLAISPLVKMNNGGKSDDVGSNPENDEKAPNEAPARKKLG
jgi:hypothetical protein